MIRSSSLPGFAFVTGVKVLPAIALGCLFLACASDVHAPFAEECIDDPLCTGETADGGQLGGNNNNGGPPEPLECLSQADLERRTELFELTPMSGMPELFLDDTFSFMDTTRLRYPARIITKAEGGGGLACTEWDSQVPFLLHGVEKGGGPVLIEPLQQGDFVSTLIERVGRSGNSPYLPVFPSAAIDQIFEDIGIERRPDRAQILTLIASGTDPTGRPSPQPGVAVKSLAAQTVAFKDGTTWTTEREDTAPDGDGLALLVNVDGYPTVEGRVLVTFEGSMEEEFELMAGDGAITYALVVAGSGP
jgi:hypothetical protein